MNTYETWSFTKLKLPEQGDAVEVIVYPDGKQMFGKFLATNNWEIRGYGVDLYNDMIAAWRHT